MVLLHTSRLLLDDSTAERVSQSVDSIEMPTGASKDGADEAVDFSLVILTKVSPTCRNKKIFDY